MSSHRAPNDAIRRPDQVKLQRSLVLILGFISTVVLAGYTVKSGNPLFMIGFVVLPFAIMLLNKPELLLVMAVTMGASQISVPGMSYTTLGVFAKLLLICVTFLGIIMNRRQWSLEKIPEHKTLYLFGVVVVMLMVVRGSGLRILGSATWGGMVYITMLISIAFMLITSGFSVGEKHIRWMVWGSVLFGAIGAYFQYIGWESVAFEGSQAATRLRWLTPLAYAFIPVVFAIKTQRRFFVFLLALILSLSMFALTGDRKLLIYALMSIGGYGYFVSKSKPLYFVRAVFLSLILWVVLVFGVHLLPLGVQRAASIIPGIEVDYAVAKNAEHSVNWRLEIWGYCIEQSKQYLVLGRGSAFDVAETAGNLGVNDLAISSPWLAFQTRNYHSGPLSLLIDYGLPGFLVMLAFVVLVFKRLWGFALKLGRIDTFYSRYALFLCVSLMMLFFKYFFIMGNIPELGRLITEVGVTYIVVHSVLKTEGDCASTPPK